MKERLVFIVTSMVAFTLCVVIVGMVSVLLTGFFYEQIDNNKIFELIGPAFQTIIGGFIGLLAGVKLNQPD